MTDIEVSGTRDVTVMMRSVTRFQKFGTFSFVTGLIMVFGIFGLLRSASEFSVVLTFLIAGILFIVSGVVLLTFSRRIIPRLKKDEVECSSDCQEEHNGKPPSYDSLVRSRTDGLPEYKDTLNISKHCSSNT